jgi:hypothetical protein
MAGVHLGPATDRHQTKKQKLSALLILVHPEEARHSFCASFSGRITAFANNLTNSD